MEKLIELKDKMHEHSETIGLILELILVIAAVLIAVTKGFDKLVGAYNKQKIKLAKNTGKADVKIQKLKNRETVRAAKREIRTQRMVDRLNRKKNA